MHCDAISLHQQVRPFKLKTSDGEGDAKAALLPCLFSNNSIIDPSIDTTKTLSPQAFPVLSTQHKKTASALAWNVQFLAQKYSLEKLGFLTLTFADNVTDPKEAQRRFNSLACNVLRSRYLDYVRVWERQKSGRIHYHLVVVLKDDIRTGFNFAGIDKGDYSTANPAIRSEWAFWRSTAKAYGFGRTELLPVKSTADGIARYVGKYISKHVVQREERDKGYRLVEYSRGARMASARFAFHTEGSSEWRRKMSIFAGIVSSATGQHVTFSNLSELLGSKWAFKYREYILSL